MDTGIWVVVAAGVGAAAGFAGSALERRTQRSGERKAAAAGWLAAVDAIASAYASLPAAPAESTPGRLARAADAVAARVEQFFGPYAIHTLRLWFFSPMLRPIGRAIDQFWIANARLVLIAPADVLDELRPVTKVIAQMGERPGDRTVAAQWDDQRPAALEALRKM